MAILRSTARSETVSPVIAMAPDTIHMMVSAGLRTASSVAGRGVYAVAIMTCKIETF